MRKRNSIFVFFSEGSVGCDDVEHSESELCFCDTDFCNAGFRPKAQVYASIFAFALPLMARYLVP